MRRIIAFPIGLVACHEPQSTTVTRVTPPPPGGAGPERLHRVEGGCALGAWHRVGWGP